MKVVLIFIFSSFLLCLPTEKSPFKKRTSFQKEELKNWKRNERSILIATQTGNKKEVSRNLKESYRVFGLLHLMTPSGIHLSSILILIFLFVRGKYRLVIYVPLLIISFYIVGFYSLKRIIYFHLFKILTKKTKASFILTFLFDLIFGGYTLSPMSFSFSFLCWGTIIFSETKTKLLCNLFTTQLLISFFLEQELNFLGLFVNPMLTGIFSSVFPLLSLNFWVFNFTWIYDLSNHFIYFFNETIIFTSETFSFLNFYSSFSVIVLFLLANFGFSKKRFIGVLIFLHFSPIHVASSEISNPSYLASQPDLSMVLKISRDKYFYFNRVCKRNFRESFWEVICKKKALRYGGPELY